MVERQARGSTLNFQIRFTSTAVATWRAMSSSKYRYLRRGDGVACAASPDLDGEHELWCSLTQAPKTKQQFLLSLQGKGGSSSSSSSNNNNNNNNNKKGTQKTQLIALRVQALRCKSNALAAQLACRTKASSSTRTVTRRSQRQSAAVTADNSTDGSDSEQSALNALCNTDCTRTSHSSVLILLHMWCNHTGAGGARRGVLTKDKQEA
eukprot:902-Heterococcus_DN1.PRE.2